MDLTDSYASLFQVYLIHCVATNKSDICAVFYQSSTILDSKVLWYTVNPCFDIRWVLVDHCYLWTESKMQILKLIEDIETYRNWTSNYRDQKSTIKRCKWKGVDVSQAVKSCFPPN